VCSCGQFTAAAGNGERATVRSAISAPINGLAGPSTEAVDNPVDKVFDNLVNPAGSLDFLNIANFLGFLQAFDFIDFFVPGQG
jgi:hypothetical protein